MANETCKSCKRALVLDEESLCAYCELTQENGEESTLDVNCGICKVIVEEDSEGLFCDVCNNWFHNKCNETPLNYELYALLNEAPDNVKWFCDKCIWETEKWIKEVNSKHQKSGEVGNSKIIMNKLEEENYIKSSTEKDDENGTFNKNDNQKRKGGRPKGTCKKAKISNDSPKNRIIKNKIIMINNSQKITKTGVTKKEVNYTDESDHEDVNYTDESDHEDVNYTGESVHEDVNYTDESDHEYVNESDKGSKAINETGKDFNLEEVNESGEVSKAINESGEGFHHEVNESGEGSKEMNESGKDFDLEEVNESGEGSKDINESGKGDIYSGQNINVELLIKEEDITYDSTFEVDPEFQPGEYDTDDSGENINRQNKKSVLKHVKRHKKELRKSDPKHQCPFCKNRRFRFHKTLVRHLKLHEEKECVCPDCNRIFKSEAKLRCHKKNVHVVKMYNCEECGKKLKSNAHLIQHMRVHTGEKPFACTLCDYRTAEKGCLKTHIARHTGEKSHLCSTCGYRAYNAFLMKQHLRIHTGEKPCLCSICGKSFSSEGTLRDHVMIHTGTKPYECNVCGYRCIQKGVLNRHMQTHASKPQFECTVCGFKCKVRNYLARHMLTHKGHQGIDNDLVCENSLSSIEESQ